MLEALAAIVPSVCVGLLFWFVIRAMIAGDRRERAAIAAMDAAERRAAAIAPGDHAQDPDHRDAAPGV